MNENRYTHPIFEDHDGNVILVPGCFASAQEGIESIVECAMMARAICRMYGFKAHLNEKGIPDLLAVDAVDGVAKEAIAGVKAEITGDQGQPRIEVVFIRGPLFDANFPAIEAARAAGQTEGDVPGDPVIPEGYVQGPDGGIYTPSSYALKVQRERGDVPLN